MTDAKPLAAVVALDHDGRLLGRARLLELYGARGELRLDPMPRADLALAVLAEIETMALERDLVQLELDRHGLTDELVALLVCGRRAREEPSAHRTHLTWPLSRPRRHHAH